MICYTFNMLSKYTNVFGRTRIFIYFTATLNLICKFFSSYIKYKWCRGKASGSKSENSGSTPRLQYVSYLDFESDFHFFFKIILLCKYTNSVTITKFEILFVKKKMF
jgi:hypothetical protein